jgi:hypothetical protein
MSCLGVFFALTHDEVVTLKSFISDDDRLEYLQEEIEETYWEQKVEYVAETDKSWDAMHRLLSNGEISYNDGPEPLRFVVIGGEPIYKKGDYIMSLKTPAQVKLVSEALPVLTKEDFREKYDTIDEKKYDSPKAEDDFEYTWDWFGKVLKLYEKAAAEDLYILFTADQ